jgi:hypothetical protein
MTGPARKELEAISGAVGLPEELLVVEHPEEFRIQAVARGARLAVRGQLGDSSPFWSSDIGPKGNSNLPCD